MANECRVTFYQDQEYSGGKLEFTGPVDVPRCNDYVFDNGEPFGDNADSLIVGSNGWAEVYEDENYEDTVKRFGPNRQVTNLDDYNIGDNIDSFRLYDEEPAGWVES